MTYLVGGILLLVFLAFAALMFLERLSALLALPLMAVAFISVAVLADLLRPAMIIETRTVSTEDALGRPRVTVEERSGPSRFAQWKSMRRQQARLLHDKAQLLDEAITAVEEALEYAGPDPANRLVAVLAEVRDRERQFDARVATTMADARRLFAGNQDSFQNKLNAIAGTEPLASLPDVFAGGRNAEADATARRVVEQCRRQSAVALERHAAAGEPDSQWFHVSSAAGYALHYLLMIINRGALYLHAAIIATVFGGMFAVYVKNLKVAERLVYWTAEYAGERPFVMALAVFLVTAGIFTSVGGLGTVIMLGTIILPILRSVGLGPIIGAGIFLIAIAMGGTLHPVTRRLWLDFYGIPAVELDGILWTLVTIYAACGIAWIAWGTRRRLLSSFQAVAVDEAAAPIDRVPIRLMIAPLIPVVLVYFADIDEITAFTVTIAYMYICVCRRQGAGRMLARSLIEGAQTVMPPVLLMVGIGLLFVAVSAEPVQSYLRPMLARAVPHTRLGYILLFSAAAPLALYRGPLNVWGMGLAVSATLLAASSLSPAAVLCAILAAGMLQGVCDPTNTANVWIAGFQGVTVNQILRYTVLPVWAGAIVAIVIFGTKFVGS